MVVVAGLAPVAVQLVMSDASAATSGVITGDYGLCLDDSQNSNASGTVADLWNCDGTSAQQWTVEANGTIVQANGLCLDVVGGGTADGTKVQLYTCNGSGAQVWTVTGSTLVNPQSGKCLDDPGASSTWGTQVQIYTCNGTAAQNWVLPTPSTTTAPPVLTFSNSSMQSSLGTAYSLALTNLLDDNTVKYNPSTYDQSGLMNNSNGYFIQAGGGYDQPWTRDASVNSWNAASLLEPTVAENTLWSDATTEASGQPNGQLILKQDTSSGNEWWDQVIWVTAAWNQYLMTGDRTFLTDAYQTAANTVSLMQSQHFNSGYGLFEGPAFLNDGIAGYPAPPADSTESQGSFVGSYSATNTMMTLSTNCLYYNAFVTLAQMASALGQPASVVNAYNSSAASLKAAINNHLWDSSTGTYGYFIHGADSMQGQLDPSQETAGLSFAIMFGIASASQASSIMQKIAVQPYGVVDTYPNWARYSLAQPGRHNVIVWPPIEAFWASAAAQTGDIARFSSEVQNLAHLADSSNEFYEIYNSQTGVPDGGWQTGGHWGSAPNQTWSATGYLRMIYSGLFGMGPTTTGMTFQPTLPSGWGSVTLSGVQYRGATLNITLQGAGDTISSFDLDGVATSSNSVPTNLTGTHSIVITLTNPGGTTTTPPTPPGTGTGTVTGYNGECLDDYGFGTTNGTVADLYTCNGGSNQRWTVNSNGTITASDGLCLDVVGAGSTANGTLVDLWACNGGANQVWQVQGSTLVNPQSGKCLDDPAFSTTPGTQLDIWACNGGANQNWDLP